MGNMVNTSGTFYSSGAGFSTMPTDYYDAYSYNTSNTTHARGKLGDATKETALNLNSDTGAWGEVAQYMPYSDSSWFVRGGSAETVANWNIFYSYNYYGDGAYWISSRPVLTITK